MWWDHPRSRGEHSYARKYALCGLGIIPAHAGSTTVSAGQARAARDHPRSRGEHELSETERGQDGGSSPLTRGALNVIPRPIAVVGIIPAHAGSTTAFFTNSFATWDHPRSRGEHPLHAVLMGRDTGSSPLTRGAPLVVCLHSIACRIIPAHAGSTRALQTL